MYKEEEKHFHTAEALMGGRIERTEKRGGDIRDLVGREQEPKKDRDRPHKHTDKVQRTGGWGGEKKPEARAAHGRCELKPRNQSPWFHWQRPPFPHAVFSKGLCQPQPGAEWRHGRIKGCGHLGTASCPPKFLVVPLCPQNWQQEENVEERKTEPSLEGHMQGPRYVTEAAACVCVCVCGTFARPRVQHWKGGGGGTCVPSVPRPPQPPRGRN